MPLVSKLPFQLVHLLQCLGLLLHPLRFVVPCVDQLECGLELTLDGNELLLQFVHPDVHHAPNGT